MILDKLRAVKVDKPQPNSLLFAKKLFFIKLFFVCLFLLVLGRSLELQIFKTSKLDQMAINQYQKFKKLQVKRGSIYDTNGKLLSSSIPYYSVFALKNQVKTPELVVKKLAKVLDKNPEELADKIYSGKKFIWLAKLFNSQTKQKIENLKIAGIHVVQDFKRYYPLENLASHILGFVGYGSQGLEGIEYHLNKHLLDEKGLAKTKGKTFEGGKIFLTIDENIQYFLEKELKEYTDFFQADYAQAIIMETKTANVLALANYPNYNPNNFADYENKNYFNRAVTAVYEPGSTFKVITAAAVLEEKLINANQKIYCEEGSFFIGGRTIKDTSPYGYLNLQEILQKSSNICALKVGMLLNKKKFHNYIRQFGFGAKTNIELPGESKGIVHNYKKWSNLDNATISYGHSILVTPIQMITAVNTIANDGVYISPKIVKKANDSLNQPINISSQKKRRVISKATARLMKKMLISVTQKGGTAYLARIKGINIAGKTGTSRKYDKEIKAYSTEKHLLSFVATLPAENPQLTFLVILDSPKKSKNATYSAAPLFKRIAKNSLRYYNIKDGNQLKWQTDRQIVSQSALSVNNR